MKKLRSILAVIFAIIMVITACGKPGSGSPASKDDNPNESQVGQAEGEDESEGSKDDPATTDENKPSATGGTLRFGEYVLDTQMANKSPFATSGTFENLFRLIYETPLLFNEITGELLPALANSYEWNADFSELKLEVNPKPKWHDGEAFTVDDIVYTFQALKENPSFDKFGLWNKIEEITADGGTVTIKVNQPFLSLPYYISQIYIVPKHIWEKEEVANYLNDTPIGTGPFIYKTYNTGTDIQFDANKDYWRGAPKVNQLVINMYNTAPNVTLALLKGEIDATFGTIAMPSAPEFMSKENAKMQIYSGLGNFSVIMNHENELLADVNVRKAMAMAINQSDLIAKGESNCVLPTAISWLPRIFGDHVNKEVASSLEFNLEAAQEILENAGYTKGKDGIYEKNGKRLSFTYHNASGAPAQQMEAGMIQQWLLNLGVEIIPKLATWPELTKLAQNGEFDLIQLGISFPPDPYAALNTSFNSSMTAPIGSATSGTNYSRFRSQEVDGLLEKASKETDSETRKQLLYEIQSLIAESYVFLPMYNSSGHIPYYDGTRFTGWEDSNAPINNVLTLINIRPVE